MLSHTVDALWWTSKVLLALFGRGGCFCWWGSPVLLPLDLWCGPKATQGEASLTLCCWRLSGVSGIEGELSFLMALLSLDISSLAGLRSFVLGIVLSWHYGTLGRWVAESGQSILVPSRSLVGWWRTMGIPRLLCAPLDWLGSIVSLFVTSQSLSLYRCSILVLLLSFGFHPHWTTSLIARVFW